MYDDEIWDEHRWEDFLSENDRQMDRRLTLYYDYLARHPRPKDRGVAAQSWFRDLQRFFADNGLREDDAFLQLFSPDRDEDPAPRWLRDAISDPDPEDDHSGDPDQLDNLEVYRKALDLSVELLRWSDDVPIRDKDSTFVQFCTSVTQIPANIAKGHGIGFERDMIGGNIACTKRGLHAANEALYLLKYLKKEPFLSESAYFSLYERLFEIRNQLGIYVQTLRERFDLGID